MDVIIPEILDNVFDYLDRPVTIKILDHKLDRFSQLAELHLGSDLHIPFVLNENGKLIPCFYLPNLQAVLNDSKLVPEFHNLTDHMAKTCARTFV